MVFCISWNEGNSSEIIEKDRKMKISILEMSLEKTDDNVKLKLN
jgi:hypothetical protein